MSFAPQAVAGAAVMTDMRPLWLVFAVGNPSRGDDALGPALVERLELWLAQDGRAESLPVAVSLLTDFQHQVEHALDLAGVAVALFVDASGDPADAPFSCTPLIAAFDATHSTHALSAACVLAVAQKLGQRAPESWRFAVAGEGFELGAPLSDAALRHLDAAETYLQQLLRTGRATASR